MELKDGSLILRGERTIEHEEKKKNYHRIERAYGSFERSFIIPEGVKEKDIHARYKDGVLELTMPVPESKNNGNRSKSRLSETSTAVRDT